MLVFTMSSYAHLYLYLGSFVCINQSSLILRASVGFSIFSLKAAKEIDASLLVLGEFSVLGNWLNIFSAVCEQFKNVRVVL